MKFNKLLTIGINESNLDAEYWKGINQLTEKVVYLPKDSPEVKKELTDVDCLLVFLGTKVDKVVVEF